MTNYPLGVTSKDYDEPTLDEPIDLSISITDLTLDNGRGSQDAILYAEVTVHDYDLNFTIESAYYELIGNDGEELGQVDYTEGKNLAHDLALIAEIERQFKKRL